MKHLIKIILFNICFFLLFFVLLEFIATIIMMNNQKVHLDYSFNVIPFNETYKAWDNNDNDTYKITASRRKPVGIEYTKKKPIVIFGGSFGYGDQLRDNQNFSYKLSQMTQRPVYNRAFYGGCPAFMLYQLQDDDFYKNVPEPEFVIYVYIEDHINRLYYYTNWYPENRLYLRYHIVDNKIKRVDEEQFIYKLSFLNIVKIIQRQIVSLKYNDVSNSFQLLFRIFEESQKEMQKHGWKNTKIVFIKYRDYWPTDKEQNCAYGVYIDDNEHWDVLKNMGITILDTKNMVGNKICSPEYVISDSDTHPNEEAWNLLTPIIVEQLNL